MEMISIVVIVAIIFIIYSLKTEMEYNPKYKDRMTDYLPWVIPLEDGTIINKNGSITKIYKYKCDDMEHQTDFMLFMHRHKINDIFKRLDERFVLHIDSIRKKSTEYPDSKFKEKIFQEMDDLRKENYLNGRYFESENYLSITYFPPKDKENKIKELFYTSASKNHSEEILEKYYEELGNVILLLKENFLEIDELTADETVTYLHTCFSGDYRKIKYIKKQYLDGYISDVDIKLNSNPKQIGNKYLKVLSILSYIDQNECSMFDDISKLGIEYRWSNRFIYISREKSIKISEDYQKAWNSERTGTRSKLVDKAIDGEQVLEESEYANEMKQQAAELSNDTRKGVFKAGYYSFNIVLLNEDLKLLNENVKEIMTIINNLGFVAVEETVNCLESFFGTMPGNVEHGIRNPLLTTYNLFSFVPITGDWAGSKFNKYLKRESLIKCQSGENSSFDINLNARGGDVFHTLMLGMTGAGKSVALNTLAYQSKKYGARVIIFDKGGSSRVTTRACGGKFYNIGKDDISFQPLRYIDKDSEKEWALEWILTILKSENFQVTPEFKGYITEALTNLSSQPEEARTITSLALLLQNSELYNILKLYTRDEKEGIYGKYFDNDKDDIRDDNLWQVFEMENIFNSKMINVMLMYLFHRIETELFPGEDTDPNNTIPTLLIIDEGWGVLQQDYFRSKLKDYFKTLRKKQVWVVLATQSLSDIAKSSIKDVILESCPTKIYLPNRDLAPGSQIEELYYEFGLNEREIALIRSAQPKREYYFKSDGGKIINLNINSLELAYVGASSPTDQATCELIYKEVEGDVDKFNERWKKYKGVE